MTKIETKMIVHLANQKNLKINNFLEIGSRHGLDAEYVQRGLNIEPENIHIIEAHPKFSKDIEIAYPKYNVYNFGAWNTEDIIVFNAAKDFDDGRSSLLPRDIYQRNFEQVDIKTKRIDQFILEEGIASIDACKIDVEGASFEVLEGFGESLNNVKLIQIAAAQYNIWERQKDYSVVYSKLEEYSFKKIWEIKQGRTQLDSLWVKE